MTLTQQNWPLRYRAVAIALLISLFASSLLGWPIMRASVDQLEQQSVQLHNTLSKQVSVQAAEAIFSQDLLSLNVILSVLVEDPNIRYSAVYDLNNRLIAEQGQADVEQTLPISIRYQDEVIGLLELRLNPEVLSNAKKRLYGLWFVLTLLVTILVGTLAWFIGRYLGRRLHIAEQQLTSLTQATPFPISGVGELHTLSQAIHNIHQDKQAQQAMNLALNQFMTPNVNANLSLNYPKAELPEQYAHAAVLFIDMVDLPGAQQALAPLDLAQLLNQYYFLIHQAAKLYNGTVDKYVGDGVMVLFGLPQQDEKDCFHGVCSALLLIGLLNQFNQSRRQQHLPVIEFKLGLHTGSVLAGTFGDQDTLTYTAIGDTIHTAARLCRRSDVGRLLISKAVLDQGRMSGQLLMEKHGSIQLEPEHDALETFWVNHLIPTYQALIERQVQHILAQQVQSSGEGSPH